MGWRLSQTGYPHVVPPVSWCYTCLAASVARGHLSSVVQQKSQSWRSLAQFGHRLIPEPVPTLPGGGGAAHLET